MFRITFVSMQLVGLLQADQLSAEHLPEAKAAPAEVCESNSSSMIVALAASLNLDETLHDAIHEAIVVLTVFAIASLLLRIFPFRRKLPAQPPASKASAPSAAKVAAAPAKVTSVEKSVSAEISQGIDSKQASGGRAIAQRPTARSAGQVAAAELDSLAQAARSGRAGELPQLLDRAYARAVGARGVTDDQALEEVARQHLLAVLRSCASAHRFREALVSYDHVAEQRRIGVGSGPVWSVLLYNATEAGAFHRGEQFFQRLCKCHGPSAHDFVNVVRCYVHRRDLPGLKQMLADLHSMGHTVDAYARNRALAACTGTESESALNFAEAIVTDGKSCEALDAIGYNTLMKFHARAGSLARCFELRADMNAKGLEASDVTFGILLDACVGGKDFDRARRVFEELCNSGLRLNVVHCTTFLKGLVGAGRLDEAHDVLCEMRRSPGANPDLITYSILVKAYADRGNVTAALDILEQMVQQGIRPDEIICHSVLTGCCSSETSSSEVMSVFNKLVSNGMKPSTMTFSILLKALAICEDYAAAMEVLSELPRRFGLTTEARLFAQVAQAAIRAHRGEVAVNAYIAMLEAFKMNGREIDPAISSRLLRHCATHGEHGTACQISEAATRAGLVIDERTLAPTLSDASSRRAPAKGTWRRERSQLESMRARAA